MSNDQPKETGPETTSPTEERGTAHEVINAALGSGLLKGAEIAVGQLGSNADSSTPPVVENTPAVTENKQPPDGDADWNWPKVLDDSSTRGTEVKPGQLDAENS